MCRHNHTDGCGWFYETGATGWRGREHQNWLEKAGKFAKYCEINELELSTAIDVIQFSQQLR
jgi:hypothetical protein